MFSPHALSISKANPASDADLIALARAGDDRAFAVLVDRYEGAVAATVIGMLGRGDDADDVGQETFIRFHRALGNFRGESSLKTYLIHIAMNLSLNALKRRRRSLLRFVSRDDDEDNLADLLEPRVGPSGDVDAAELHEFVRAAVARLSEKHRAVVVLRLFHEFSTRETAELLGLPEGTVLSRLSRAMKELESQLRPYVRAGAMLPEVSR